MIAKLLAVGLTRRLFLRSPVMGAVIAAAPKPALPKQRREIELVRTFVAGTAYYDAERAFEELAEGQELTLRRQPDNPHDRKAIEVYSSRGSKLGYVPRIDNSALTALLDDGRQLRARIMALRPVRYQDIRMAIALVD
jgi:HIRAN domain-containing protein